MSTHLLVDDLRKAIAPHVTRFIASKSEAALTAEAEIKKLEAFRKTLAEKSPALKGIDRAIADLRYDPGDDEKQRKAEAALAVVTVCNALDLPVMLKPRKDKDNKPATTGTPRPRMAADVLDAGKAAILKSLKTGPSGKAELLLATDLDDKAYGAVKRALLKDGKIKSVGEGRAAKLALA